MKIASAIETKDLTLLEMTSIIALKALREEYNKITQQTTPIAIFRLILYHP